MWVPPSDVYKTDEAFVLKAELPGFAKGDLAAILTNLDPGDVLFLDEIHRLHPIGVSRSNATGTSRHGASISTARLCSPMALFGGSPGTSLGARWSSKLMAVNDIGKWLIIFGMILVILGATLIQAGKIPWLGRLRGDIYIQRRNFTFFFPLTTSILLSVVFSLLVYLFSRR